MDKSIKIILKGKALEKFYWIKQEMGLEDTKEVLEQIFILAIEVLKETSKGGVSSIVRKR